MRYGIFGGTFDPVHRGHLHVAQKTRENLRLDKMIWVPALSPPHKDTPFTPFSHRLEMVRLAIADMPGHLVSDLESRLPQPSYSINSIRSLKQEWGGVGQWYFLIGADNWESFSSWHQWEEILREVTLVIFPRSKAGLKTGVKIGNPPAQTIILDLPEYESDSSAIRTALRESGNLDKADVLPELHEYIRRNGLYGIESSRKDPAGREPWAHS